MLKLVVAAAVAGIMLIVAGVAVWSPPAALIVAGGALLAFALFADIDGRAK